MPETLPSDIQAVTTTRGRLYELPARHTGGLKYVAIAALLLGLGLVILALYLVLYPAGLLDWLRTGQQSGGRSLDLFKLFWAVPAAFFGLSLLRLARFLMGGRSTIEIRDDTIICTNKLGIIRRRKSHPIKDIRKFQVKSPRLKPGQADQDSAMCGLNVVLDGKKTKNLTWGYPKSMLLALAEELSYECENSANATTIDGGRRPIEVEQRTIGQDRLTDAIKKAKGLIDSDTPTAPGEIPPQPADSDVMLETHQDGLTLTVPPVGVRKGGKGLFGFAIMWNGFMVVFTGFWLTGVGSMKTWELLPLIAFFTLFWGIGIGMMLGAVNAGRRTAILDVVGDTLLITRKNIFKTTQQEVQRDNIEAIRRDKSGVEVNDVPVLNLQVHLHQGKKIAMLSQLTDDELAWIAAVLREALSVRS